MDRGGDRKRLLEPLLEGGERFVIRSTGKRPVIDRRKPQGSVAEEAGRRRLGHRRASLKSRMGNRRPTLRSALRRRADSSARPSRATLVGSGSRLRRGATDIADQPAGYSQGLTIPLVDCANLPYALKN